MLDDLLNKLTHMISDGIEYVIYSFLVAAGAMFVSKSWRENRGYFFAAVFFGTVVGAVANNTPGIKDFSYLISLAAAMTAPATLAAVQHKTLADLLKNYADVYKEVTDKTGKPKLPGSEDSVEESKDR